ncbi:hypothetical protein ACLI07_09845 [Providencia huaxiensis]|uniref:phage tail fiber protein n=1 Tax=Providencia huaxiensis TaxID=2027290 RepID=UPI003D2E1C55
MYSIGTVTTTANSTKLVGAGTKWLNNINRVSAEQAIQIQIGTTVYNNSIQSIQSDTELTLNFPLPTAATGAKYVILTTMVHSASDAMNKIVSMNVSNVQFSDILTRWMTEQGIITVTLPDQTTQQLRTTKEMDKQLDGKLNKLKPEAEELLVVKSADDYAALSLRKKANGGGERVDIETVPDTNNTSLNIIYRDKEGKNVAVTSIPKKTGTAMLVGEYGVGGEVSSTELPSVSDVSKVRVGFYRLYHTTPGMKELGINDFYGTAIASKYDWSMNTQILAMPNYGNDWLKIIRKGTMASPTDVCSVYTTKNTTKDTNGNIKAASPIIKVFADHIELNEESEGVELEKLDTGRYKLKGTLGMHSDASWGGIHGGLVVPNGINNLPLVWADFDVLPDGDIVIETRYRKHALHQMLEAQRLMTYPEFLDENNEEREDYDYCDIPNGHWIDVRVNMPSNSLYNQKQAEAERLAKLEAERLAQEEAKRAAEEAERAGQEAAERKQYDLGDNDALL